MSAPLPRPTPPAWLDAIARGEADLAAGRVSDLEPFLQALEAEDETENADEALAPDMRGPAAAE